MFKSLLWPQKAISSRNKLSWSCLNQGLSWCWLNQWLPRRFLLNLQFLLLIICQNHVRLRFQKSAEPVRPLIIAWVARFLFVLRILLYVRFLFFYFAFVLLACLTLLGDAGLGLCIVWFLQLVQCVDLALLFTRNLLGPLLLVLRVYLLWRTVQLVIDLSECIHFTTDQSKVILIAPLLNLLAQSVNKHATSSLL